MNDAEITNEGGTCSQMGGKLKGILLFSTSIIVYSCGNLLFKWTITYNPITSFELQYWVALTKMVLFLMTTVWFKQDLLNIEKKYRVYLILRFFVGALNDTFLYFSFMYLTFAKATCFQYAGSLFVPFLAYYMLGDQILRIQVALIFIGFIGILIMVRPFSNSTADESPQNDFAGSMIACGAAVTGSLVLIFMRKLQHSGLHFSIVPVYYALGSLIVPPMFSFFSFPVQPLIDSGLYSWELFGLVLGIALIFFVANLLFTISFNFDQPSTFAVVQYIGLPVSYLQDWIFFNNVPGPWEIAGAVIILFSNLLISVYEIRA